MKTRFVLFVALGLLIAGKSISQTESHSTPLVRSGAALGANLLERLGSSAESAGYRVEIADVRTQAGGIKLVLPGLVLTPPVDHLQKSICLPVVVSISRAERLCISFRAITNPKSPLPEGSSVRIVLRQLTDEQVIVEKTTNLTRGWITPTLDWVADRDRPNGEFVVEVIPVFVGPIKITFPQGLLLPAIKDK